MIAKILKPLIRYSKSYLSFKSYISYRKRVGPAKRQEYWRMLAIVIACYFLEGTIRSIAMRSVAMRSIAYDGPEVLLVISSVYFTPWAFLVCFYLSFFFIIAHSRCDDIGISHWYLFLVFVYYINIALIILLGVLGTGSGKKIRELKKSYFGKKKNKKKIIN